ncbi:hypothetical protein [Noviherbaspirillum autotrophicum]|uniref:Uncharacterized protein n=1 Tax=Noviherbaspirillum autotrophicum TaxID=709839 RepID=A0A0C1Y847_9BURK|nr:hypothetical protein [Noviherbaspirillum autotrophicum]KIF83078.1 hypothetical protein TSA66_23150 [Noviherbaspirillum autotrophicum]
MKKSLVTSLIALPLLTLSSMAFAATEVSPNEPMLLSAHDMDSVTAGGRHARQNALPSGFAQAFGNMNFASIIQIIYAPVTVVQIGSNNTALVYSIPTNFASVWQR